jgi:HSP20 family molecular chaperone IbpA
MAQAIMNGPGMPAPLPRDIFPAMWYEMYRLFEPFERAVPRWPTFFREKGDGVALELDVVEHTGCITIEAELPGVDMADLAVTMANGMLTIKGEKKRKKEDKDENYYLCRTHVRRLRAHAASSRNCRLRQGRGQVRQRRTQSDRAKEAGCD